MIGGRAAMGGGPLPALHSGIAEVKPPTGSAGVASATDIGGRASGVTKRAM